MKKRCAFLLALFFGASLLLTVPAAHAGDTAVVDTVKILSESKPGKEGEAHLQKVQTVLQKGLDELQALYKGKENTPEAQAAIRDGYVALERQLAAERQAVLQVLGGCLEKAVKTWRAANSKYDIVISRQALLDSASSVDVTMAVMKEMDKQKAQFSDLPTVKVTPPEAPKPAPAPKKK